MKIKIKRPIKIAGIEFQRISEVPIQHATKLYGKKLPAIKKKK